jgi:hypothetical protein
VAAQEASGFDDMTIADVKNEAALEERNLALEKL